MDSTQAESIAREVFALYEQYGSADYIGEPVSQVEHMYQAAQLASNEGYDDEVVLSAFFHDIGHLCEYTMSTKQMDGYGVVDHEALGATYLLEKGFSPRVAALVKSHVAAKRYLTGKYPDYYERLSPASRKTLRHQGGPMNAEELTAFESDRLHQLYIKLREWDDKAKMPDQPLPALDHLEQMAINHLQSR